MEAADDISYCLSDIEDGIEKRILSSSLFFEKLLVECDSAFGHTDYPFREVIQVSKSNKDFFVFKIDLIRKLETDAVKRYIDNHSEVISGTLTELIDKESSHGKILDCLKVLSRKYLFRSSEAENKELAGYHAIYGILDKYQSVLELNYDQFCSLVTSKDDLKSLGLGVDFQWRLYNRLPEKHIEAYKHDVEKMKYLNNGKYEDMELFKQHEWYYRAHLIVDYVSGMTDNYVMDTYNLLYGIKI